MRVFVTGASGFIGSAVVPDLIAAGHTVLGLARSDASAAAVTAQGAQVHRGDIEDLDSLRSGAADADGVIHLAYNHDFSNYAGAAETDRQAIEALGGALEGTGRPLVIASGTGGLKPGAVLTEHDQPPADGSAGPRMASAQAALSLAERGVRVSVVRLPPSVHSEEKAGFAGVLVDIARAKGVSGYAGDGATRWPAVHVQDAAHLFRLALENAAPGTTLHAVGDEGVPTRTIAEVIARGLDIPLAPVSPDDVPGHFGFLAAFMGVDIPASSSYTRELMGWQPTHPGLVEDLEKGRFFDAA